MKKIILDLASTLDGFIEGPNGEIDWCVMDDEMNFDGFLSGIDTIFYGRVSYDLWGNFQPGATAGEAEKKLWSAVHSKKKYVFSRKPGQDSKATFITGHAREHSATEVGKQDENAAFITSGLVEKVKEIQQQEGGDIWLYGGAKLIKTFIGLNLIDIYRISVHPIVLGAGKPLFEDVKERVNLRLTAANRFKSGVVQLIYKPKIKWLTTSNLRSG